MSSTKPLFIVFEGIDGSGKSTLCKSLTEALCERGIPAVSFTEPTHWETGQYLRKFLRGEIELERKDQIEAFLADREESLRRNVLPSLRSGRNVLLDRYFYSTAAYQSEVDFSPEEIVRKNLERNFPLPDVLFFLDLKPALALERLSARTKIRERFETLQQLERIYDSYRRILPPETIRIDAEKTPEVLVEECLEILIGGR